VRELSQCLSTAAALATDGLIKLEHLPPQVARQEGPISLLSVVEGPASAGVRSRNTPLSPEDEALRADLVQRLEANGFNISAVAREMGKARQQVQRWVRRFNLRSVDE
jgi:transcriptional regulator of acetoin/glycerol metabolism